MVDPDQTRARILGLGTDLQAVDRFRRARERRGERLLQRLFTEAERAYCESRVQRDQHYAARFAAKEAGMKALGTGWRGGIGWRDLEVAREPTGRPVLLLAGAAARRAEEMGATCSHLTLTHDEAYAMAVVILESVEDAP